MNKIKQVINAMEWKACLASIMIQQQFHVSQVGMNEGDQTGDPDRFNLEIKDLLVDWRLRIYW